MSELPPPAVPPTTPPPPGGPGGTYTPPPPPPPPAGGTPTGGSSDRTLMLILSYFGIFALIPLLTKKDDPEVQWHAKNGLAIALAEIAFIIVWEILFNFVLMHIACVGFAIGSTVWCLFAVGTLVIFIVAVMKALRGERLRLPVITEMAEKM